MFFHPSLTPPVQLRDPGQVRCPLRASVSSSVGVAGAKCKGLLQNSVSNVVSTWHIVGAYRSR